MIQRDRALGRVLGQRLMAILVSLMVMAVLEVRVAAQGPTASPTAAAPSPPITCSFANTSMISSNWCNYNDQSRMEAQTVDCKGFLTNSSELTPSAECCRGFNDVAYNRTACICMATFYPPSTHNESRQLVLPRLCGLITDLCGQCPTFLVSRSNGTASLYIADQPYSKGKPVASTVGAIALAIIFGLLLVGGIMALIIMFIKKRRAKNNPSGIFEAPPPGGAF
ncbi:uncharacterized protein [Physcomitrium patens]|uniref:Bifunctional inhibitor/plant lipid transfer protein/seed storage helical domain-containing protein n=1 Tax=Physcomitrium patens TaxID=3218 RepID=A0A2K1KJP4_PHYPA|nr:uncharacterized protein LOC112282211 [Physcomitrium patens]XP_024375345.1 uncharacterized protein LOC112282211 [Physcomitrium patens]XP_024375346.1 uncharacterized protein LOC112282211 [Physcomitrium patens]PNR54004.1 hypothetical protein PHYPA_007680 [Physcomitrium patens]|eukprot:XP_024375344.1 uncharacterized protein LOC112282211 [Physcomitrella patens]